MPAEGREKTTALREKAASLDLDGLGLIFRMESYEWQTLVGELRGSLLEDGEDRIWNRSQHWPEAHSIGAWIFYAFSTIHTCSLYIYF